MMTNHIFHSVYFLNFSAWILKIVGHELKIRHEKEEEDSVAVSQKCNSVKVLKPSVSGVVSMKKKKKNNGMEEDSQFLESDSDSE